MDSLKQLLIKSVIQNKDNDDLKEFKKLVDFIDNNIKLSLSYTDDEIASFLLTSLLSLRSYMNSKIVIESASNEINNKLIVAINNFFTQPIKVKKKLRGNAAKARQFVGERPINVAKERYKQKLQNMQK